VAAPAAAGLDREHGTTDNSFILVVAAPPGPPAAPPPSPEALFEEAHRRRRARRLRLLLAAGGTLAAAAGGLVGAGFATGLLGGGGGGGGAALAAAPKTVVLVVDVSGSMGATDLAPTRLGAAVAALGSFVARLPGSTEVGIVAFSTSAEVVQEPTRDRRRVRAALRSLRPESGTALGDGLAAAVRLARGATGPAAIVLESDGAQNRGRTGPLEAAAGARAAGIPVYGISLGTPSGAMRFGAGLSVNSIPVPPDPKTVAAVSRATGGAAFTAATRAELGAAYARIGARFR